jgi:hypothetical protein
MVRRIHSLGVLLTNCSLKNPFDAEELVVGSDEIRHTIREVEPPKPSRA